MIYKHFLIVMECDEDWQTEKWLNSLKLIKDNPEEYEELPDDPFSTGTQVKEDKYMNLNVYSK